jgi:hypothetical protein
MSIEKHGGMMSTEKVISPPEIFGNPISRVMWYQAEERAK